MENIDRKESMSSIEGGAESADEGKTTDTVKLSLLPPRTEDRRSSNSSLDQEKAEISTEERQKIIEQAEFYFSDENLKKDGFLLKHVKRNKEGYVNLKLLASFKKMRTICKDFNLIAEILKDSTKLDLNETGLKIKRKEPLPKELFETVPVKSVVVSKIPNENPSMDYIAAAFGSEHKDKIASVRIVKQGKKYPHDLQSHFARHPELADEIAAVVEFEDAITVTQVLKIDFESHQVYKGLVVCLLEMGPKQGRKKKKNPETGDYETASATSNASDYDSTASLDTPIGSAKKRKTVCLTWLLQTLTTAAATPAAVTANRVVRLVRSAAAASVLSACTGDRQQGHPPTTAPSPALLPTVVPTSSRSTNQR